MYNFICLLWKGEFRERDYTDSDVNRLVSMLERQLGKNMKMFCLTNDINADVNAEIIPLIHNWPGWWSKVEVFRLDGGQTLYIDLDISIVGNITKLFGYKKSEDFVMFRTKRPRPRPSDVNDGLVRRYHAGVMRVNLGSEIAKNIYGRFSENSNDLMNSFRAEQDMYGKWYPNLAAWPDEWLMKIKDADTAKHKGKTIIVSGHSDKHDFRRFDKW